MVRIWYNLLSNGNTFFWESLIYLQTRIFRLGTLWRFSIRFGYSRRFLFPSISCSIGNFIPNRKSHDFSRKFLFVWLDFYKNSYSIRIFFLSFIGTFSEKFLLERNSAISLHFTTIILTPAEFHYFLSYLSQEFLLDRSL